MAIINDDYENGCVIFFDPASGQELGRTILGETSPFELSYSNDSSVLWAADAGTVYRIDPQTFELLGETKTAENEDERNSRLASAPDGASAAVLTKDGKIFIVKK